MLHCFFTVHTSFVSKGVMYKWNNQEASLSSLLEKWGQHRSALKFRLAPYHLSAYSPEGQWWGRIHLQPQQFKGGGQGPGGVVWSISCRGWFPCGHRLGPLLNAPGVVSWGQRDQSSQPALRAVVDSSG